MMTEEEDNMIEVVNVEEKDVRDCKVQPLLERKDLSSQLKASLSHVGLLLILVIYTLAGGLMFRYLELPAEEKRVLSMQESLINERRRFIEAVVNNSDVINLSKLIEAELRTYEIHLYEMGSSGVSLDQEASSVRWNLFQSIFFASTVLTTIGYGHVAPVTFWGRAFCVGFALVGIPITLSVIANMGKLLASAVATLNSRFLRHIKWNEQCISLKQYKGRLSCILRSLSAIAAVILLLLYLAAGAALFTLWEDWTFFEGFYFCFITMTTIGFGDLVPKPECMLICTLYILVGLAFTSTFIELMRRQYAESWQHMKELSARLYGITGSLSDTLRKIDMGKVANIDAGVLAELKELSQSLAIARIEVRIKARGRLPDEDDDWAREVEEAIRKIKNLDSPKKVMNLVMYETSV